MTDPVFKPDVVSALTERATREARAALSGPRPGLRRLIALSGPAVVASIAYMDPGNFATNIEAGARFGYSLLWVVLLANLIGMLFQALAARLGFVTGLNLAEHCRLRLPRAAVYGMWLLSELVAMATELAELVGAAIGLQLLCGLPLLVGMLATAAVVTALLGFERRGFRPLELMIAALVATIGAAYLIELVIVPVAWPAVFAQLVPTRLPRADALMISVAIVGATVMPHALFLHSGLTQNRVAPRGPAELRRLLKFSNLEVAAALGVAGLINLAMVITAAGAFHERFSDIARIDTAYHTLRPLLGDLAALLFLTGLIAAGVSSSVVGAMAGQVIMQGFVKRRLRLSLRRFVTMAPSFVVIALGIDATRALVLSQVVLSFALPLPMFMLIRLTASRAVMGPFRNRRLTTAAATLAACVVTALNAVLVWQGWAGATG
ncbi:Nramp family divalent metal transporter [Burkholderia plantarii]|uniref:Nramp family divalent metal transporter n=1 Tax=Burkholderia plantarii TaxID=41899 RepID=UPI00272D4EFD|nr:Nramp family divalent metal transporter [Burkholderia plantarii]WLE61770.1 Nramp family divalent metal transporter [Burkholderia plantarii]